jgi:hypothetical protein
MEVSDIIAVLRRQKNLNEEDASEQAHAMLASVRSRHRRLEITEVVVDGHTTTLRLKNGTEAKFDPSLPVPIWKYTKNRRATRPKSFNHSVSSVVTRAFSFYLDAKRAASANERQKAAKQLATIYKQWGVSSIDELADAVERSLGQ